MEKQVTAFDTETTSACDDVIEANKEYQDAKDRLDCTKKHLGEIMVKNGLGHKQFIRHSGHIITLRYEVKDPSVSVKMAKD